MTDFVGQKVNIKKEGKVRPYESRKLKSANLQKAKKDLSQQKFRFKAEEVEGKVTASFGPL
jgi:hypothetical protein